MPKFDYEKLPTPRNERNHPEKVVHRQVSATCSICQHPGRRGIDKLLAIGQGYAEISRAFNNEITTNALSNHAKKHLDYNEAAIKTIVEHEAALAEHDLTKGVQGILKRKVLLEIALQKGIENLVSGDAEVSLQSALDVIRQLDKMEGDTYGQKMDEIRLQFQCYLQAMKELVDEEKWIAIAARSKDIYDSIEGVEAVPQLKANL